MPEMRTALRHATADPDSSARCLLHFLVGVRVFTLRRLVRLPAWRSISVRYPDVLDLHGLTQERPAFARTAVPVELAAVIDERPFQIADRFTLDQRRIRRAAEAPERIDVVVLDERGQQCAAF